MNNALETADILSEFLEIAVHTIIQARKLYPDTIFVLQRKYGAALYKSIHPELNAYITECVNAARFLILENSLERFSVCFLGPNKEIIQRFIFQMNSYILDTASDPYFIRLEQLLRTFCTKLAYACSDLPELNKDCTFSIQISTVETGGISLIDNAKFQHFPWLVASQEGSQESCPIISPITTMKDDALSMQIYLETFPAN